MKTLKDILEVYQAKSKDERRFVDKHIVVKHKDRNGNGDDVFQATNIKTVGRKDERHGYDPNEDEKVYEEVDQVGEVDESVAGAMMGGVAAGLAAGKLISTPYGKSKRSVMDRLQDTRDEKKFHKYSIKQADKSLKQAKNPETIDRLNQQKDTAKTNLKKTSYLKSLSRNEEVEIDEGYIEEKLTAKDPAGKWISDFVHSDNPKFAGKSKKERMDMALGAYYAAKRGK